MAALVLQSRGRDPHPHFKQKGFLVLEIHSGAVAHVPSWLKAHGPSCSWSDDKDPNKESGHSPSSGSSALGGEDREDDGQGREGASCAQPLPPS